MICSGRWHLAVTPRQYWSPSSAGRAESQTEIAIRPTYCLTAENTVAILLLTYHRAVLLGGGIMKTIVKRAIKDEKGAALALALVLLVVGGLILTPLLGLMSTGLLAGQVYEKKTDELYAADAGVEDAIWKIMHSDNISYPYHLAERLTVNSKTVNYDIYREEMPESTSCRKVYRYQILSTAVTDDGGGTADIGSGTQIEAYVAAVIKSYGILDNVITTPCGYAESGPSQINPPEGEEHGPVGNYTGAWPTVEMLSDLYWEDVKEEDPYDSNTLYIEDYTTTGIRPFCRNGTLNIKNTGSAGLEVELNGTLYITGDTDIGQTNHDFTIDLNGQTIFVESATGAAPEDDPCNPGSGYALRIGGKCTFAGSGCIIAVGGIEFMPNLQCSNTDYILVLSVRGKTYMKPNGDFYGTLAGHAEVDMQNADATWTDYSAVEGGLNFPDLPGIQQGSYSIASWEIGTL